jgi:formylglycine-generating enzyme required for sulfatase activity
MVPDKSVFGEQFVRAISGEADVDKDGYVTGSELGDFLQSSVVNYSRNSQHPQYGKIRSPNLDKGDFVFPIAGGTTAATGTTVARTEPNPQPAAVSAEVKSMETPVAKPVTTTSSTEKSSKKRGKDKKRISEVPPPVVAIPDSRPTEAVNLTNDFIPMVYVPGGTFNIGEKVSGASPKGPSRPGAPRIGPGAMSKGHPITLKSFYIGKFEITQKQWKEILGNNPSTFKDCENCPVEQVSWEDVQNFLNALNQKTGKKYRLPTEAEWEYAALGGNKSMDFIFAGGNNVKQSGWSKANGRKATHVVGQLQPNELGIYDMSGNVLEWCSDWFNPRYYYGSPVSDPQGPRMGQVRSIRGGSWKSHPGELKIIFRKGIKPGASYSDVGFRIVREE